jgi:hypothetical protein
MSSDAAQLKRIHDVHLLGMLRDVPLSTSLSPRCDDRDAAGSPCVSDTSSEDMFTLVRSGEVRMFMISHTDYHSQVELVEAVEDAQINGELPVTYNGDTDVRMQVRLALNCYGVCICERQAPYVRFCK